MVSKVALNQISVLLSSFCKLLGYLIWSVENFALFQCILYEIFIFCIQFQLRNIQHLAKSLIQYQLQSQQKNNIFIYNISYKVNRKIIFLFTVSYIPKITQGAILQPCIYYTQTINMTMSFRFHTEFINSFAFINEYFNHFKTEHA